MDLENAEGGVNGRKINLSIIDDQTNPALTSTAVQRAISNGTLGIVSNTPFFFEAAKFAQQAGVPVTGNSSDGPEWGEQPYTNMFDAFRGSEDPEEPVNSIYGNFLKAHGGTTIGTYGYGVSPLSADEAKGAAESFVRAGGKVGVVDTNVPFGSVVFTSEALTAHQQNVDAILPTMDGESNFALVTALEQEGVKLKAALLSVGYEPSVINSPAWPSLQGTYFLSLARPFSLPNAGTEQMAAALMKYAGFTERVSELRPGPVVAGLRPHHRWPATCRGEPDPCGGRLVVAEHQVLQRQRAAAGRHRLLDGLRTRSPPVCLDSAGREVGLRADLVQGILRDGLPGNEHEFYFVGACSR